MPVDRIFRIPYTQYTMKIPSVDSVVRVTLRDRMAASMIPPRAGVQVFEGRVVKSHKWLTDREFCITGDADFPIRVINASAIADLEIISAMKRFGSTKLAAEHVGMSVRALAQRKAKIQIERGIALPAYSAPQESKRNTYIPENRRVIEHRVDNGHVFIASDCHYWPGESTVAHKAFVKLLTEFKAQTCILNGDCFDGARISRHPTLMNTNPPTPKQEIEACQDRLDEIANASKNATKLWTYGNHDVRAIVV